MQFHQAIKYIRKKVNMTQDEISKDIVSRTSYSRFENGDRVLSISDIEKLANRLGIQLSDIIDIQNEKNQVLLFITQQCKEAFAGNLDIEDIEALYRYTDDLKDRSMTYLRYHYYVRQHFNHVSNLIPELSKKDTDYVYKEIKARKNITAIYLQFIIDFTAHFSDEQILDISTIFKDYDFRQISSLNYRYAHQLPDALFNLADRSIDRATKVTSKIKKDLLNNASKILETLINYQKIKYSSDHVLLYRFSKYRLEYYKTENPNLRQQAILNLREFLEELYYLKSKSPIRHVYAEECVKSIENLLSGNDPSEVINYIIN